MIKRVLLGAGLAIFVTAAAHAQTYLDPALRTAKATPAVDKILVLPPDVQVSEISLGGVIEKVPAWTKLATEYVSAAVARVGPKHGLPAARVPQLQAREQVSLEQHLALFDMVAGNVQMSLRGGDAWQKRIAAGDVDFSLGPGLAFLAEQTGADAAVIVMVRDFAASPERKAMMIAGALFGVAIPLGRTFAVAALVDLRTGRLLWESCDTSATPDLRVAADANRVIEDLFQSFPIASPVAVQAAAGS